MSGDPDGHVHPIWVGRFSRDIEEPQRLVPHPLTVVTGDRAWRPTSRSSLASRRSAGRSPPFRAL
jgi:hypothetical protein